MMKTDMLKILEKVANKELKPIDAERELLGLFNVIDSPDWLTPIDLYISKQFYNESMLKGIAYLDKIAQEHIGNGSLRWSRDFLNNLVG